MGDFDAPWTFTVTWEPDAGALPAPILRLFHHRSTIEPGRAVLRTDEGHGTFYERAVMAYVQKHRPERTDITTVAEKVRRG